MHLIGFIDIKIAPYKVHVKASFKIRAKIVILNKKGAVNIVDIHEVLKSLREDSEFTQERLAQLLGTTRQQIYKYETGVQDLSSKRLKQYCLVFGVTADYILGLPKNLKWPR